MQPSFEFRIATMVKALSETVRPAVDVQDKAAVEQLNIVIASLSLLGEQVDFAHWFEMAELAGLSKLARSLLDVASFAVAPEEEALLASAAATAGRHDIRLSTVRDLNVRLRALVSGVIERAHAVGDVVLEGAVRRIVLEQGKPQIDRERAFVAGTGFDVFGDTLKSIEAALSPAQPG